jgi:DNA modification methylase
VSSWQVIEGDCLERLREFPDGSCDCCVTSPPYWNLRDYGVAGQLGLEQTLEEYVANMVAVLREVRRVLADHGTCWLNLGDAYTSGGRDTHGTRVGYKQQTNRGMNGEADPARAAMPPGLKPKDLCGIPWRVAFALQADGWWLRSDIIWAKGWSFCPDRAGNPMPESVRDRPVRAHEYVFLLSKSERYYYDDFAVREAAAAETVARLGQQSLDTQEGGFKQEAYAEDFPGRKRRDRKPADILKHMRDNDGGQTRNLRDVWAINTRGFAGAHFAVFPEALVEPCIRAVCPAQVCAECGKPWVRQVERSGGKTGKSWHDHSNDAGAGMSQTPRLNSDDYKVETLGFAPTCACDADTRPGTVLDPFCGSGTTGVVAMREGRNFVGIELSPAYAEMARQRLARWHIKPSRARDNAPEAQLTLEELTCPGS